MSIEQTYYREWGKRKIVLDEANPGHFLSRFLFTRHIVRLRKKIKTICEIGCGVGLLSNSLGRKGFNVHGYDMDEEAIKLANLKKAKNTDFFCHNVYDVKDKQFDAVISSGMLEHVEDDVKALENINKIIRPGGYLFLGLPHQMRYWTTLDKTFGHYRRYEEEDLRDKLRRSGFIIEKVIFFGYPLGKWFTYSLYLRAAKNRKKIISKARLPFYYYLLYVARYLILIDCFFNSKKEAINILFIAKKKDKPQ